jgi:hypothetical protein
MARSFANEEMSCLLLDLKIHCHIFNGPSKKPFFEPNKSKPQTYTLFTQARSSCYLYIYIQVSEVASFLHDFISELCKNLYSVTENLFSNSGQATPLCRWIWKCPQKLSLTKLLGCATSCSASCAQWLLREYEHTECRCRASDTMPLGFLWSYRQ